MDEPASVRELVFSRERETKRFVRFAEQPENGQLPVIGTLYVRREVARNAQKASVRLTLERE